MSIVDVKVGARNFQLACEDGEESHLQKLAGEVDVKIDSLSRQMRTGNELLLFLMTALTLQDELNELDKKFDELSRKLNDTHESEISVTINTISDYIETLVDKIEARKAA